MEIKINGTVTINTESSKNQSEDKFSIQTTGQAAHQTTGQTTTQDTSQATGQTTQATTLPTQNSQSIDRSNEVLIDNSTTFNKLISILLSKPEVAEAAKVEVEEKEQEAKEARLRQVYGEDYDLVFDNKPVVGILQKAKRRPGPAQLRTSVPRIAAIDAGHDGVCEVYVNGYAIYDNGNRKVVLWVPDCGSATYYFTGLRDNEKEYLNQSSEIGLDVLGDLPWYHALMIAGENRIEYNMDHPKSKGNTSDFDLEEVDVKPATHWVGSAHFDSPEEAYLKKEAAMEVRKGVEQLKPKQRDAIQLCYFDDLTQEDAAQKLKITQSNVNKRVRKGEKALSGSLKKYFFENF